MRLRILVAMGIGTVAGGCHRCEPPRGEHVVDEVVLSGDELDDALSTYVDSGGDFDCAAACVDRIGSETAEYPCSFEVDYTAEGDPKEGTLTCEQDVRSYCD